MIEMTYSMCVCIKVFKKDTWPFRFDFKNVAGFVSVNLAHCFGYLFEGDVSEKKKWVWPGALNDTVFSLV